MARLTKRGDGFREGHKPYCAPARAKPTPKRSKKSPTKAVARSSGDIAKIFMNGRSQAVRLPKAFRLPGKEVRVRREGDTIVLEPMNRKLDDILDEIHRLTQGQFPERPEQPPMPDDDDELSWD
jgi:antitoxin VapB